MRLLLIRPGAIGDFLVSLPALEFLASEASYAEVWTTAANVPLARFADCAKSLYSTGLDTVGLPGGRGADVLDGFDHVVSWYGANRPDFRGAVAARSVAFHQALPPENWNAPAADFYLHQVNAPLGLIPGLKTPPDRQANFAVIHPFSGGRRKNWPLERFQEVAARLPLPVHWTAGPEEPLEDAVRFDNLWDLATWLAAARLFIGNDSGISHLAAAVGIPVVAIFGPTNPNVWAPNGKQVQVVRAEDGRLESVGVDEVVECARSALHIPGGL